MSNHTEPEKLAPVVIDGEACCPHCQSSGILYRRDAPAYGYVTVKKDKDGNLIDGFESCDLEAESFYSENPYLWCQECEAELDETCVLFLSEWEIHEERRLP